MPCRFPGCTAKTYKGRDICPGHISQLARGHGLHAIDRDRRGPLAAVFWNYVERTDGCWLWLGGVNEDGYGDRMDGDRHVLAHRFSWEIANGPIPDGLLVLHKCDVRRCVRPDHLFLGTHRDNQLDKMAKGREAHFPKKLTESDVIDIRSLTAFGAEKAALREAFSVSDVMIGKIIRRECWRHVP